MSLVPRSAFVDFFARESAGCSHPMRSRTHRAVRANGPVGYANCVMRKAGRFERTTMMPRCVPASIFSKKNPQPKRDISFSRNISAKLKAEVFDRNGFTCQMCGATPGEFDVETGRKVRLHVGHIVDKSLGGRDELSNLRTLCSSCNQGAKNITSERPTTIWLLAQVRRAGMSEQRAVFDWLQKKFRES